MADEPKKDDDEKKPVPLAEQPEFKQMMGVIGELGKTVQQLTAGQTATSEAIDKLVKGISAPPKKEDPKGPTTDEVDEMSQSELAQHIFAGNRKMLDGLSKDLGEKLSVLNETTSGNQLTQELREFGREHKDLKDWLPEIKQAIEEKRFINIADAYNGVRTDDPDKVVELDKKYADKDDDDEDKEKKPAFGGLTPTSGRGLDKDGEDGGMSKEEAQETAWEEAFGDQPELAGIDTD